ncbi:MAG: sigma-70 family RNA polymerase sigma factor [Alphaproteobacteria bacterium]|nr:sigma-70 family RNA polymerase sigma factor [Alphaproteobacteria bacterium]MBV9552020.1 sigma-70 family RNA polymerase sigma factor [Alphaproteobacteria bacterium]
MPTDADMVLLDRREANSGGGAPAGAGAEPGYAAQVDEGEVIRQFMPAVKRLALRLKARMPETVQLDDMIQAGLIAVLRLLRQGSIGSPAAPVAQRAIANAMIDEVRREAWAPVRTIRRAKEAARAMRAVKSRLGRDGGDEEIAAEMGIALGDYHAALLEIAGIRLLQIDEYDAAAEQPLQATDDQATALDRSRMMADLTESIAALPERERLVLSLYYEQELNMEEVGAVLGLDKSTVCRAHGRALLMLRSELGEWRAGAASPTSGSGG